MLTLCWFVVSIPAGFFMGGLGWRQWLREIKKQTNKHLEAFPHTSARFGGIVSPSLSGPAPLSPSSGLPAARHPLCQLSCRGRLLCELPHSLMLRAFCTAKDHAETPAKASRGSSHMGNETQAPCEVLHEMLLPASPRNCYALL